MVTSERTLFHLYQWQENSIRAIYDKEAEFGLPQWVFGQTTFAFIAPERLICRYAGPKESGLALLNTSTGEATTIKIPEPYTSVGGIKATEQHIVFRASSPTTSAAIIHMDIQSGQFDVLRKSQNTLVNTAYLSIPQHIEFPTEHNLTAYAYYYPPKNEDYQAPADELPPLLVISHGGPTSSTSSELSLGTQYWTSRGFAVLDVDYGGSTGYGRPYRERLNGQWGIVDVDDCVNGAKYLVAQHLADPARLAIRGGSAGGYTTLAALTFRDTFKAGASHFGVSDIEGLAQDTHKFESRYMIGLVGPYPENVELYHERSPLYHTELFSCPVIFFQGLEDKIVPPNQAEKMVDALRARKIPVSYVTFEGEQHGFRKAENIKRSLEGEFYFYSRIFNYTPADTIKPVKIENM
jgi:dipeptidyl aminopeptidase/acylaminoacyl peptidase